MRGVGDRDFALIRDSDVKIVHEALRLRGDHVGFARPEENGEVLCGALRRGRRREAANREIAARIDRLRRLVLRRR